LNAEEVVESFIYDIMPEADNSESVNAFADYMLETYISPEARYPPDMWAALPNQTAIPRTTNGAESFHQKLKLAFSGPHPNIFVFANALLQYQEEVYIKAQSIDSKRYVHPNDILKTDFIQYHFS